MDTEVKSRGWASRLTFGGLLHQELLLILSSPPAYYVTHLLSSKQRYQVRVSGALQDCPLPSRHQGGIQQGLCYFYSSPKATQSKGSTCWAPKPWPLGNMWRSDYPLESSIPRQPLLGQASSLWTKRTSYQLFWSE